MPCLWESKVVGHGFIGLHKNRFVKSNESVAELFIAKLEF
jgi:hypothetical protein